jgi:protein-glucosylgalactosylhydroxylysine glucosidase
MLSRRGFITLLSAAALSPLRAVKLQGQTAPAGAGIDRFALLQRHDPHIQSMALDAVLSVGNGNFAFNVDCTGLQSLPAAYTVIPLATLSHWGWHSRPMPAGMNRANFRYKMYNFHGRQVPYATDSSGQAALFNYLRENPHRLNLGRIGLVLDGKPLTPGQIANIDQRLDLATGIITSRFELEGRPVEVITCCHPAQDGVALRITSPLGSAGRLSLRIEFGYGSTASSGDGADWTMPAAHQTTLSTDPRMPQQATLNRTLDQTHYGVRLDLRQASEPLRETGPHDYVVPWKRESFEVAICFDADPSHVAPLYSFAEAQAASEKAWRGFWSSGAAIDLGECTDPRAPELERRIVLSQYLTAIHCAGQYPSQETGLLCNSWFGKFHLEMHWWHSAHFSLWNRQILFDSSMALYPAILNSARTLAKQQGFQGARWPKMIGPDGKDSPSPVGPLIIWQQPHPIYYAELSYRSDPSRKTLDRWRDIVMETADFLASFAQLDPARNQYVLGPAIRTVSENNKDGDINPTWELTAWRFALATAQQWRERLGMPRNPDWDKVLNNLAQPTVKDGLYMMQEGQDTFTKAWAYEHPALLGALGVLPGDGIDPAIMAATARKVREVWDFSRIWGWDYPVAAMCAARTLQPELAVDFLTMEAPTNKYLANGCNFQRDNVPAYFPGNGGLLAAIAMMAAGWDGGRTKSQGFNPGFPKNGKCKVKSEGFLKFI